MKHLLLPFTLITLLLSGCGINKEALQSSERAKSALTKASTEVTKQNTELNKFKQTDAYKNEYKHYAEQDKWDEKLSLLNSEINSLQAYYKTNITPLLEQDSGKSSNTVITHSNKVTRQASEIIGKSSFIEDTRKLIEGAKKELPKYVQQTETADSQSESLFTNFRSLTNTYKENFPDQVDTINSRYNQVSTLYDDIQKEVNSFEEAYQTPRNYLTLPKSSIAANKKTEELKDLVTTLTSEYEELEKSYTVILKDMRLEYYITLGITTWDSSDSNTEQNHTMGRVKVSEDIYLKAQRNAEKIAHGYKGWGTKLESDSGINIKSLGLDPFRYLTGRADTFEVWLEDAEPVFYHQYIKFTDGVQKETDWEEVDQDEFESYMNALGMSIASKPYGVFEADADYNAHPPGIAFVGNDKYGEYRTENGRTFWHYYGQYAMLNTLLGPTTYYDRGMYSDWRTNRRTGHYYGGTSTAPMFGTRSSRVRTSPTLASSSWNKSGRISSPPRTVRASSSRQGGGPGGKGK